MQRSPSNIHISWFIDINHQNKLDLDPPYQRKSIWTMKDRQYFLDTIFHNYPSPTIFFHRETNDLGETIYHVVDGKQRLETILMFAENKLHISKEYGDKRFNGKFFNDLSSDEKTIFWDYILIIDYVPTGDVTMINDVFDRLNRVSKNLNEQELRHAKYDGWLIKEVEREGEDEFWRNIGISTVAKARRMKDIQFISELLIVILEDKISGFEQDHITQVYADFNDPSKLEFDFDKESYMEKKKLVRDYIEQIEKANKSVTTWAKTSNNFYILWSMLVLNTKNLPSVEQLAKDYDMFMKEVNTYKQDRQMNKINQNSLSYRYYTSMIGATTELKQRSERLSTLEEALLNNESN